VSSRVSAWKFVMFATRHRLARGFEHMPTLRSTLFGGEDLFYVETQTGAIHQAFDLGLHKSTSCRCQRIM
jgi:hypothetical protein